MPFLPHSVDSSKSQGQPRFTVAQRVKGVLHKGMNNRRHGSLGPSSDTAIASFVNLQSFCFGCSKSSSVSTAPQLFFLITFFLTSLK